MPLSSFLLPPNLEKGKPPWEIVDILLLSLKRMKICLSWPLWRKNVIDLQCNLSYSLFPSSSTDIFITMIPLLCVSLYQTWIFWLLCSWSHFNLLSYLVWPLRGDWYHRTPQFPPLRNKYQVIFLRITGSLRTSVTTAMFLEGVYNCYTLYQIVGILENNTFSFP